LSGWRTSRKAKASKAASVGGLFHFQPSPSIGSRGRFMVNSNVLRLQLAPALDLGLVAVLGEALEIFSGQRFGGRALPGEFFADERVSWHRAIKAPRAAVGKPIAGADR